MADLRFTRERSRLRGLGILTALVLAGLGGFAQAWSASSSSVLGALVCLYAFTAYLLAVTECTPAGIRTRGLAGSRRCSWSQVTDISLRHGRRSVRITVTTALGRRFWLGAPVHGGVVSDPKIYDKFRRSRPTGAQSHPGRDQASTAAAVVSRKRAHGEFLVAFETGPLVVPVRGRLVPSGPAGPPDGEIGWWLMAGGSSRLA